MVQLPLAVMTMTAMVEVTMIELLYKAAESSLPAQRIGKEIHPSHGSANHNYTIDPAPPSKSELVLRVKWHISHIDVRCEKGCAAVTTFLQH